MLGLPQNAATHCSRGHLVFSQAPQTLSVKISVSVSLGLCRSLVLELQKARNPGDTIRGKRESHWPPCP